MSPKVTAAYREEKLKRLLETAAAVFIEKGYEKTTMQDIVDACQISRGGLYKYFSSTEEIFLALLDQDTSEGAAAFSNAIEAGASAVDILEAFLADQLQMLTTIHSTIVPVVYEYAIGGRQSEKTRGWLLERRSRSLEALETLVRYGIETKAFKAGASEGLAAFVMTVLDGLMVTAMTTAEEKDYFEGQLALLRRVVV